MTRKKLLFIVNIPDFFISHRLSLALLAKKEGYEVHVATTYNHNFQQIQNYGFQCHEIYLKRGSLNIFNDFRTLVCIYKVLTSLKPDVLHLLTAKCNIYGGLASRVVFIPRVIHAITGLGYIFVETNNIYKNILKKIVLFLYKISIKTKSIVIFQNNDNLEMFVNKSIIDREQSRLIYGSGVDTDTFFYSEDSANENPIVLFPSRLLKEKGILTFIDASKILKINKNIRMVVAGDLDYENPSSITKEQIDKWVEQGLVEWSGYNKDMPKLLSQSSIVCLPTYYPEGVPKVLIEAASCGRAVITTDMPGCNEIVINNHNGLLIPIKSADDLAASIIKLVDNIQLRKKYGAYGRKLVLKKFSSKIVNNATLAVYSY
jgi:glycosyltransferase involved in cell wall biosynthesis